MRLVVYKRVYSHWQFGEVTDGDRDLAKGPQAGIAYHPPARAFVRKELAMESVSDHALWLVAHVDCVKKKGAKERTERGVGTRVGSG